ncbi:MAG: DUF2267 domain-containing protein [Myxococcaceae bacterium]|nr:DUF2267 domain-containing protein [Myxococcaceae bacterium]
MDNTSSSNPERHESRTAQTFVFFVRDLVSTGAFGSVEEAVRAAGVVLTLLEQRLTGEEARDLNAQLPIKLQEIISEARKPLQGRSVAKIHRDEFVSAVAGALGVDEQRAETMIRNVFLTVRAHISEGEAKDVASQLPLDLKPMWSEPA